MRGSEFGPPTIKPGFSIWGLGGPGPGRQVPTDRNLSLCVARLRAVQLKGRR